MAKKTTSSSKGKEKFSLQDIKDLISLLRRNNIWEFDLEQNGIRIHIVTGHSDKAKSTGNLKTTTTVNPPPLVHYPTPMAVPSSAPGVVTTAPGTINTNNLQPVEENTAEVVLKEEGKEETEEVIDENMIVVKSPMVGTFYRAPAPDAPPYVEVGDIVKEGQVLCIIEAMKLMNEIKTDCAGKIAKILVENGQPVEYGQHLFLIEPV